MALTPSRCIAFAEGSVTMVSPVLLALALKKDKWKSDVHEPAVSMAMLAATAGATLVTGVFPTLACCASEWFPPNRVRWPSTISTCISPACLFFLACFISLLGDVSNDLVIIIGALSGIIMLFRAFSYYLTRTPEQEEDEAERKKKEAMLDKSHEFLSGVTGILFLGLEGTALEGQLAVLGGGTSELEAETPRRLWLHMGTSCFIMCAVGVTLIFLQMTPPRGREEAMTKGVVQVTDATTVVGTVAVLTVTMCTLMGVMGLMHWLPPFGIFLYYVYYITRAQQGEQRDPEEQVPIDRSQEKPAPMGLTKVTFTGFLFVSVKAISGGSPSDWSQWFLLCSAAAIASGVSWRLLTQNKAMLGDAAANAAAAYDAAANVASFFTHLFVAVATVLFAVVALKVVAAKDP